MLVNTKPIKMLLRAPKLFACMVCLGLFMLIYIWYSFYSGVQKEKSAATEQAYQKTANMASIFKEHAERSLEHADLVTSFWQKTYRKYGKASIGFAKLMPQNFFYQIYLFDETGASFTADDSLADQFKRSILPDYLSVYRAMSADTLILGQDFWDEQRKSWMIPLMRRLTKPDGSYGGMVVMMTSSYYFSDLYNQLDIDPESMIFLFGRDHYVRAVKNQSLIQPGFQLSSDASFFQYMQRSDSQTTTVVSKLAAGKEYIYSYRSLARYPMIVAVGIPAASVLKAVEPKIHHALFLTIGLSIGVLFFMISFLQLMYRQRLMEAEVQSARDNLQEIVKDRTTELVTANQQLSEMNISLENVNSQLEEEVTERRNSEEKLHKADEEMRHIAYYDAGTELPNRVYFQKWLTDELNRHQERGGLLLSVNLDNLQTVNDVFGHSYGDAIIKEAAQRIINAVNGEHTDSFVAHCGADEFAVVYPGITTEAAVQSKADALIKAVCHVHRFDNITIHMTTSIGAAIYPIHGTSAEELIKNADNALAAAKKEGKNRWCSFSESMRAELYDNIILTTHLHNAIQNKEFILYYQPQIEANSGKLVGFEALVRWISPELGFVSPGSFIPLAERKGMIHEIGQWVMSEACCFASHLAKSGHEEVSIAVNVSGQQFSRDDFLDSFQKILQETNVNPKQIELEITETAMMKSLEGTISKLDFIRNNGAHISLDDFGTGYSSLNYLLKMPFDTLKIDKSFIDTIGSNQKGAQIVEAILMIAHILQKQVIAEGVETREQLDYLRNIGCDMIQGFFFSKPLPEQEALAFLEKNALSGGEQND